MVASIIVTVIAVVVIVVATTIIISWSLLRRRLVTHEWLTAFNEVISFKPCQTCEFVHNYPVGLLYLTAHVIHIKDDWRMGYSQMWFCSLRHLDQVSPSPFTAPERQHPARHEASCGTERKIGDPRGRGEWEASRPGTFDARVFGAGLAIRTSGELKRCHG